MSAMGDARQRLGPPRRASADRRRCCGSTRSNMQRRRWTSDRRRGRKLQPVRAECAADDLRHRHPQRLRPAVPQQRPACTSRPTARPPAATRPARRQRRQRPPHRRATSTARTPARRAGHHQRLHDRPERLALRVGQGGYYGHPNPTRCEYVLNGGNPTAGADPPRSPSTPSARSPTATTAAPRSTSARTTRPTASSSIHGNAFDGALNGKLLVVRYSGGDDIIVLNPNGPNGNVPPVPAGRSAIRASPASTTRSISSSIRQPAICM